MMAAAQNTHAASIWSTQFERAPWLQSRRGFTITANNIQSEGNVGQEFTIPEATLQFADSPNAVAPNRPQDVLVEVEVVSGGEDIVHNLVRVREDVRDRLNREVGPYHAQDNPAGFNPATRKFTPTRPGVYSVTYIVETRPNRESFVWTEVARSETYRFTIDGSTFNLNFPHNQFFLDNNDEIVMPFLPSQIPAVAPNSDDIPYEFVLPMPTVIDKWEEDQYPILPSISIRFGGREVWSYVPGTGFGDNNWTSTFPLAADEGTILSVRMLELRTPGEDSRPVRTFAVTAHRIGVYSVSYSFVGAEGEMAPRRFSVDARANAAFLPIQREDTTPAGQGTHVFLTSSMAAAGAPRVGNLMREITMPEPRTQNTLMQTYNSPLFVRMEVVYLRMVAGQLREFSITERDEDGNLLQVGTVVGIAPDLRTIGRTCISDTYKFIPTEVGQYRVYYRVFDAFGNWSNQGAWTIMDVADRDGPAIRFVEAYEVDPAEYGVTVPINRVSGNLKEGTEVRDGSHLIPREVIASHEGNGNRTDHTFGETAPNHLGVTFRARITLPALFATDDVTELKDMDMTRELFWRPVGNEFLSHIPQANLVTGVAQPITSNIINVDLLWRHQNWHPSIPVNERPAAPGLNEPITIWVEMLGAYQVRYQAREFFTHITTGERVSRTSSEFFSPNIMVVNEPTRENPALPTITHSITMGATPGQIFEFGRPTATSPTGERVLVETFFFFGPSTLDPQEDEIADVAINASGVANYREIRDAITAMSAKDGWDKGQIREASRFSRFDPDLPGSVESVPTQTNPGRLFLDIPTQSELLGVHGRDTLYIMIISTDWANRQRMLSNAADGQVSVRFYPITLVRNLNITPVRHSNTREQLEAGGALVRPTNPSSFGETGYFIAGDWHAVGNAADAENRINDLQGNHVAEGRYVNMIYNAHQHNNVHLPVVEFASNDLGLGLSIRIHRINLDGDVVEEVRIHATETRIMSGSALTGFAITGTFIPTRAGHYVVTYTAQDRAGSIAVVNFDMFVKSTVPPTVLMPSTIPSTIEFGETAWLIPLSIDVINNDQTIRVPQSDLTLSFDSGDINAPSEIGVNPSTIGLIPETGEFTPRFTGTYMFRLTYTSPAGIAGSIPFTITVRDTRPPEISPLDLAALEAEIRSITPDMIRRPVDPNNPTGDMEIAEIVIPNIRAFEPFGGRVRYELTIRKGGVENVPYANVRSGGVMIAEDLAVNNHSAVGNGRDIWFLPIGTHPDGAYNLTFTVRDDVGNSRPIDFTIVLGDIENPELHFDAAFNHRNQITGTRTLNRRGEFRISLNIHHEVVWATDDSNRFGPANRRGGHWDGVTNVDEHPDFYEFGQVTVRLVHNQNRSIDLPAAINGIIDHTLTETGHYTITYLVTDYAGNTAQQSFSFTLNAPESRSRFSTITLGVSLTVGALCILGIVVFFALKEPKNPNKPRGRKEKDSEGKVVV